MTNSEEIARQLVEAVMHVLRGHGPASVRLQGPTGPEHGCVVFVFPGALGVIIDEALDALYAQLGWKIKKQGQEEIH